MTQAEEIKILKEKVRAFENRLRSFEERIRKIGPSSRSSGFLAFVDPDRCAGCGSCRDVCPAGAISVKETAQVDPKRCKGCGICLDQCPSGAIALRAVRKGEQKKTIRGMGPRRAWR